MSRIKFEDKANEIVAQVKPKIEDAKRQLGLVKYKTETFIREHPAACLVGSIALGYVIGRIARRVPH